MSLKNKAKKIQKNIYFDHMTWTSRRPILLKNHKKKGPYEGLTFQVIEPEKQLHLC